MSTDISAAATNAATAEPTEPTEPIGPSGLIDFIGLDRNDFTAVAAALDLPVWRGRQLWTWIYHHRATDFETMSNLAKPLRETLAARYRIGRPDVVSRQISTDGTAKWLLRFGDGNLAETVLIPEPDRLTLCLSSQVGCTLNCRFCHTGTQTLVRNLTAGEIVGQIMVARDYLASLAPTGATSGEHDLARVQGKMPGKMWAGQTHGGAPAHHRVSNIVMMGMGEPLYNFDNVAKAVAIATDGDGIAISKRRVTVSTAGVVPMMARCGHEIGARLAVSLHAVTDELRDEIVPINRKYPLAELMAACRAYPDSRNSRRITFEYVLLRGVNDSPADARELGRLIKGIPAKVNLIPFNPWPGAPYQRSTDAAIEKFAAIIRDAGYPSPVRTPRGEDIMAACGQLKSASERVRAAER